MAANVIESRKGSRFYWFALILAGPPVWIMCAHLAKSLFTGEPPDYQSFGIGIASIITAIGFGSAANKAGSAQKLRYTKNEFQEV